MMKLEICMFQHFSFSLFYLRCHKDALDVSHTYKGRTIQIQDHSIFFYSAHEKLAESLSSFPPVDNR